MKNFLLITIMLAVLLYLQSFFGRESLISVAASFSLVSVASAIWLSLQQYSLKLKNEKVESDIKLMSLFNKIMSTAHARGGYILSEKLVEKMFDSGIFNTEQLKDDTLKRKLADLTIMTIPVGMAEQDAAIASIAKLATRHEVLRDVAIQGLESISEFKPDITKKYLEELKRLT